ncbi:MAG: DUF4384 domain-containing protein [Gemmatimonadetes bacterium]|nr:DUF4384 domain-containing protein [Gemmatimonadota bacterium]
MNATFLLALSTLLGATRTPALPTAGQDDPAVRIWLDPSRAFARGDRVQVDVRAEEDGYLLVLHADPTGRVRVLFPVDPFEDHFVRGGQRFEVRGRGDRHAFTVYESRGVGTVFAAWSPDPFRVDEFARADHWDYTLASTWDTSDDAEAYLLGLAQRMVGSSTLEYDVVQYDVGAWASYDRPTRYSRLSLYHDHYDHWGFGLSVGFGSPYYYSYYRPYYSYSPYYASYYYDPWYYDPWYDPWFYRPSWYWGVCLGWCSPRYAYGYYRYPRTVVINNYYDGYRAGRWGSGAYTFKLSPQPRFAPVQPRQRTPLATAVGRRLVTEPAGVATGRRTDLGVPARRVLGERTVTPAIGGTERRVLDRAEPQRADLRERTSVQGRQPERAEPQRLTPRDRAVVPRDQSQSGQQVTPRDRAVTPRRTDVQDRGVTPQREMTREEPRRADLRNRAVVPDPATERERQVTPRREVERQPVERSRVGQERATVREREPVREVRPRLEPRRPPAREVPRAAPERQAPSARPAPPRSSGPSVRSVPSAPRSAPARPSGGSSGARRRG